VRADGSPPGKRPRFVADTSSVVRLAKSGILEQAVLLADIIIADVVEAELDEYERGGYLGADSCARSRHRIASVPVLDGGERERLYRALRKSRTVAVKNLGEDASAALAVAEGVALVCDDLQGRSRARALAKAEGKTLVAATFRRVLERFAGDLGAAKVRAAAASAAEQDGYDPGADPDSDALL
jgi:hypothetical protein